MKPRLAWHVVWVALAAAFTCPPARATSLSFDLTRSFQGGHQCTGCGPFGTVTVSSLGTDEVQITLTLEPGEVFAFGGAGFPLLFDISGNPQITGFQVVTQPKNAPSPNGFTFSQAPPVIMADGTGTWNDAVSCSSCGGGTSSLISGTLSIDLTAASAISPFSFMQNATGLYFASDLGVPAGSGFNTGDVGATTITPVPLPAALLFLSSGLAVLGLRRRA
jgi:hypothetical protein